MTKGTCCRLPAFLLALCLLGCLTGPVAYAAQEAADVITISSEAELRSFAKDCALDTWSQGKTVRLAADLDLSGAEFTPIPTFGGTFLGQNHTISGLRISAAGSVQGLFRYVQPGGVIQDLTVQGAVAPSGTRSTVGGIVGDNSGTLQNCAFRGTVQGESMVGGVAGRNSASGQIIGCSAAGAVSGENATGGIAGRSLGLLMKCENSAGVNLTQSESQVDLMDVDAAALEQRASADEEAYQLLNGCFDTGGVVGWSSGVVQSCANTGAVGYPHVGYNTGGIAGRQSGYLAGCVNSGTVNGRKDVGGVVGQAEPYLVIDPSGDALERLQGELDALDVLLDRALNDAQRTGADVTARLEAMGGFTDSARNSAQNMLSRVSDFADDNIGSINTAAADLTNLLDQLAPALDDLSNLGGRLEELSARLGEAMEALKGAVDLSEEAMAQISAAVGSMQRAGRDLSAAADHLSAALDDLLRKVRDADEDEIRDAIAGVEDGIAELSDALDALAQALRDLEDATGGVTIPDLKNEGEIRDALSAVVEALGNTLDALAAFRQYLPDYDDLENAGADLSAASAALKTAGRDVEAALAGLQAALSRSGPLGGKLGEALGKLQIVSDSAADMGTLLRRAFDTVSGAVSAFTAKGPTRFTPLGDGFREDSGGLFDALSGLSGEMEGLNRAVQNGGDALTADLRAVNNQFRTVFDVLLDAMADLKNLPSQGLDTVFEDTSEEDVAAVREGKVADCRNTGAVEGDRNVGGVIGAMAIEFDLDPEDDASDAFSFGATYETKAVLQSCVNLGGVTAKKDCVGGLAGRMDLGTALDCQNYGPVESAGGDYVGGVAGYADASVRSCWAKSALSGENYVGGVAGWASRLRDCRAIATIDQGTECLGAIAGGVETDGVLSGCCFVDTGVAGVDGVSYAGRAEPVPFEALAALEDAPAQFTAFTLTLVADGETVARIPFLYGEDLSRIPLPDVPVREGSYGVWPEFDLSGTQSDLTLEAEYAPWITLLASGEQRGQLALALAEGQFTREAALHVADSARIPPKNAEGAVTWDVSLTGGEAGRDGAIPLRLLSPDGGDADVWQYKNGQWVAVDARRSGQYLILSMEGAQGTFFLQPKEGGVWKIALPIAAGAGGLAALLALLGRARRKKKKVVPTK